MMSEDLQDVLKDEIEMSNESAAATTAEETKVAEPVTIEIKTIEE